MPNEPTAETVAKAITEEIVVWFVQITDPSRPNHLKQVRRSLAPLIARLADAQKRIGELEYACREALCANPSWSIVSKALEASSDQKGASNA